MLCGENLGNMAETITMMRFLESCNAALSQFLPLLKSLAHLQKDKCPFKAILCHGTCPSLIIVHRLFSTQPERGMRTFQTQFETENMHICLKWVVDKQRTPWWLFNDEGHTARKIIFKKEKQERGVALFINDYYCSNFLNSHTQKGTKCLMPVSHCAIECNGWLNQGVKAAGRIEAP